MKKINISLVITIVSILLSVGGSWTLIQAKVGVLEKASEKNEAGIKEVHDFKTEQRVVNDYIQKEMKENKEELKDVSEKLDAGLRAILFELKKQ